MLPGLYLARCLYVADQSPIVLQEQGLFVSFLCVYFRILAEFNYTLKCFIPDISTIECCLGLGSYGVSNPSGAEKKTQRGRVCSGQDVFLLPFWL